MLYEVLKSIRNFFPDTEKQMTGTFTIQNGAIAPFPVVLDYQWFLIEGSTMNDGVFQQNSTALKNETFEGTITPLKIPQPLLNLVDEINTYQEENKPSPYKSESFGGYSYTRQDDYSWKQAFATRLNAWRKL